MSKNARPNIARLLIFVGLVVFTFTVCIFYRLFTGQIRFIPISVVSIIAGVIYEGKRLSDRSSTFIFIAFFSFILSIRALFPYSYELGYNFENHIRVFTISFIISFSLLSRLKLGDKVIPKLNVGITLFQSIAVFYWVVDFGFFSTNSVFLGSLMVIGLALSFFSLFHAFTPTILSRTSRLILSIWSSIIMMLFASDNILGLLHLEQIEKPVVFYNGLYIGVQFFLLGVSSIYIIQNFIMLFGFIPGRGTFFNAKYFQNIKELKGVHIDRYSSEQVSGFLSMYCLLYSGTIFSLNYRYQVLPRNIVIWAVFVTLPFFLMLIDGAARRKKYS